MKKWDDVKKTIQFEAEVAAMAPPTNFMERWEDV